MVVFNLVVFDLVVTFHLVVFGFIWLCLILSFQILCYVALKMSLWSFFIYFSPFLWLMLMELELVFFNKVLDFFYSKAKFNNFLVLKTI